MPSSNTGRLHAILLIRNHSFFGRRIPAHGSGLRRSGPTSKKKRLSPSKPPPRLPTAATPRRGSFTYPAAVTSTARPARCVSNPRKRPAATDTNPANAVWPARADRLWKLAGVLGRSPDKGRPRFSSSPNLPARPSLQSLSCVSPCSRPFPAQLAFGYDISKRTQSGPPWPFLSPDRGNPRAHGAGLSPQRPVSLRKTVTESRHPSLGPSDPDGSGVPSLLSLQLFSDRSAS